MDHAAVADRAADKTSVDQAGNDGVGGGEAGSADALHQDPGGVTVGVVDGTADEQRPEHLDTRFRQRILLVQQAELVVGPRRPGRRFCRHDSRGGREVERGSVGWGEPVEDRFNAVGALVRHPAADEADLFEAAEGAAQRLGAAMPGVPLEGAHRVAAGVVDRSRQSQRPQDRDPIGGELVALTWLARAIHPTSSSSCPLDSSAPT
ncbi:MAG: hypothetical protein QOI86_3954 [Actinomycetota bacterium]|jgi:hypothetical protein|nr:hypothetical protein [Actinomycetota bacterium]